MFGYKIYNKPKNLKLSKQIIVFIFEEINKNITKSQNGILNIIFEGDDMIRQLNKNYRGIDKSTDVLSFHYFDDFGSLKKSKIAGEIILSFDKIESQSKEFDNTIEEESYKLLVHSILHILGFDHENDIDYEKMKIIEDEIIEKINKIHNIAIK
ncbi:MAG: rRNA maturation RNase YbeY [Candidatus Gracilibacteria bacterium]|nr:rRNA maturation RNase YbeY [Candidatus Gracilibacteria bacterium]MDD2908264.1 rRNA maturation RNase YbeY [Candidatus Gracilibacteria bacterium]